MRWDKPRPKRIAAKGESPAIHRGGKPCLSGQAVDPSPRTEGDNFVFFLPVLDVLSFLLFSSAFLPFVLLETASLYSQETQKAKKRASLNM